MKSLLAALVAACAMIAGPAFAGTLVGALHEGPAGLPKLSHFASSEIQFGDLPSLTGDASPAPDAAHPFVSPVPRAQPVLRGIGPTSRLPEPSTWAAMLAGFGLAGASLRRGRTYRLVERTANGRTLTEEFPAPDDDSALERALSVADHGVVELWRGGELVQRFEARSDAHA